jgi:hypothetical protein
MNQCQHGAPEKPKLEAYLIYLLSRGSQNHLVKYICFFILCLDHIYLTFFLLCLIYEELNLKTLHVVQQVAYLP